MVTRYSLEVKRSGRTTEGPSDVRGDSRLAHIPPEVTSLQYIMLYCTMGPLLVSGSCHVSLAVLKVRRTASTKSWSTCPGAAGRGGEGRGGEGREEGGEGGEGRGGEGRGGVKCSIGSNHVVMFSHKKTTSKNTLGIRKRNTPHGYPEACKNW